MCCRKKCWKGYKMIRIREIALPPEHNVAQLSYEAARLLKISNSKVRKLEIVRRSVDARKKPDVKIVYTIDVGVDGNENKILKSSGCKRAQIAPISYYKPPRTAKEPEKIFPKSFIAYALRLRPSSFVPFFLKSQRSLQNALITLTTRPSNINM